MLYLQVQSDFSSILVTPFTTNFSSPSFIFNLCDPNFLCDTLSLVWFTLVSCMDDLSSASNALKTDLSTEIIDKDKHKESWPIVNVTYVTTIAPRSGVEKRTLVDLEQTSGVRLRRLWPQTSYPTKSVLVDGVFRTGIQLPEGNVGGEQLHPEVVRRDGSSVGRIGIWASAHIDPRLLGFRVVTKAYPVETVNVMSPYSGNGTGSALKSFIRKNS